MPSLPAPFALTLSQLGTITKNTPTIVVPTPPDQVTEWTVIGVDQAGGDAITYPNAKAGPITEGICVPEIAQWNIGVADPDIDQMALDVDREVQIYRNGHLLAWVKPRQRRTNSQSDEWAYQGQGALSYLLTRNMGEANRKNYLKNGSFDADLSNWTNLDSGEVTATHDTVEYLAGVGSMKLVIGTPGSLSSMTQLFSVKTGPIGLAMFFAGWYRLEEYDGPAGPGVQLFAVAHTQFDFHMTIDSSAPVGSFQLVQGHIILPPNFTDTIALRLGGPGGIIHWDEVEITVMESVSLIKANSPLDGDGNHRGWYQEDIALFVFSYLAGQRPVGSPYTKSKLTIGRAKAPGSSTVVRERTYQFADHQTGYQGGGGSGALDEWPQITNGFDYRVDLTPTSKVFRTYYPALGVDRTALGPFVWRRFLNELLVPPDIDGEAFGILGYSDWGETIDGAANNITELSGWGTDSGRIEGGFADYSTLGGVSYELVESAPTGASIDQVRALAVQRGAQLARVLKTPVLTMADVRDPITNVVTVPVIGVLRPGDLIAVRVDNFSVQLKDPDTEDDPAVVRITQTVIDPQTDTLQVAISIAPGA